MTDDARLEAAALTLAYDRRVVAESLDVRIADGSFTVIVGPNACGKSTLLRALARVLKPRAGAVLLDGKAIEQYPSKHIAKQLGMLPQSPVVPGGIVVEELVARGRFAHQRPMRVLDLCAELHEQGRTVVAVLHDLNHACRYATELIVMRAGRVVAQGSPADVMTAELVEDVFAMPCRVIADPETDTPMVVPADRHRRRGGRAAVPVERAPA